ncbi:uncharacterized protein CcaverHIS019_0703600 [Cutaneotrichosporon cavernicola]|uniref:Uncharacterized protein n=1 Tax=Cutaneotrichosporon cavernicola TaxID=279322 RepID=A0AA48LA83_9TREE|nr:uncharacterized protein CcaverHIS019_0703600 [Cutaneotrichosporon cavernicola]BEI94779.1 hypothetical protein CcaverHIS019_0703600 [Cutaneotrichosporon cavernicola]BEJ02554.1 hypothetical protein CcaverHIS631_0703490 [Cutaneotrichosporon cavernicola]BEJ10311.1 hypothetical protein CcaverHIS641_0703460 [Cutaneotrichosporon cavernicola]
MDAIATAAGVIRIAAAMSAGHMCCDLFVAVRQMQETLAGFCLGILLPIVVATMAAMRFKRSLAEAGVDSVAAPLCLFATAVPLHIVAVHVAALDVVAGRGWARLRLPLQLAGGTTWSTKPPIHHT